MSERFELLEPIGRGAMGVVWRAHDSMSGTTVAVKLLRGIHADDSEYVERFAREVELARRVRSPHVVRVLGYGARSGVPFVVLEYVPGRSLRDRLTEHGRYDPADARSIIAQVGSGLAAVHTAGVVHRDVKASNVLVTTDGLAKLTDFGIARAPDAGGRTGTGTLLGTPAYMAPEGPRDACSDLYSLGVLYYELLAGGLPFAGTSYQEVILAHVRQPPDLSRVPASERDLVGWLLEKDPSRRPQRAEELLVAFGTSPPTIKTGLPGDPGVAPDRLPGKRTSKFEKSPSRARHSVGFVTGALIAVGTVATLAIVLVVSRATGQEAMAASPLPSISDLTRPGSVAASAASVGVIIALGVITTVAMAITSVLGIRRSRRQRQRLGPAQLGWTPKERGGK